MAHCFQKRIYFSDTDAGGIVYHARYLDFAEHARTELLREVRSKIALSEQLYVVKSLKVVYHSPAYLDDLLVIETTLIQAKRYSLTFLQRVFRGDEELATLEIRVAAIDPESKQIASFDPAFAQEVERL